MKINDKNKLFKKAFIFSACQEWIDDNNIWNPKDEGSFKGGLQINVYGYKDRYLQMADFFRALAQMKNNDHDHFEIESNDGKTRLHFIFRCDEK